MLRVRSLSPAEQRELRHWRTGDETPLARRAQFVLWSAQGWCAPAMAHTLGCCRRTVRRWLHAFLDAGLAGLLERSAAQRDSRPGPMDDSAIEPHSPTTADRLVPVVPISLPELRRILVFHRLTHPVSPEYFWHWSTWRRYKQALAIRSHYQKRGVAPPEFGYLRL